MLCVSLSEDESNLKCCQHCLHDASQEHLRWRTRLGFQIETLLLERERIKIAEGRTKDEDSSSLCDFAAR
ncbi:hypothetical protein DsansV1_C04g0048231 [Dioscorea sansibarensis]